MSYNKRTIKKLKKIEKLKLKRELEPLNEDELNLLERETELREALERSEEGINYENINAPNKYKEGRKQQEKKRKQQEKKRKQQEKKKKQQEKKRRQNEKRKQQEKKRKYLDEETRKRLGEKLRQGMNYKKFERKAKRIRKQKEEEWKKQIEEEWRKRMEEEMLHREERILKELPVDIAEFMCSREENKYLSKQYKKLLIKYHPDKHPDQIDLYTYYTQMLNRDKISLATD